MCYYRDSVTVHSITKATCRVCTVPVPSTEEVVQPRHALGPRASQTQHNPSRSFVFGNTHRGTEEHTIGLTDLVFRILLKSLKYVFQSQIAVKMN